MRNVAARHVCLLVFACQSRPPHSARLRTRRIARARSTRRSASRPSRPFSQLRRLLRNGHSSSSADKVQVALSRLERCRSPRASVLVAPNSRPHLQPNGQRLRRHHRRRRRRRHRGRAAACGTRHTAHLPCCVRRLSTLEAAPVYVFLAAQEARYVTGEVYGATGGTAPLSHGDHRAIPGIRRKCVL